MVADVKLILRAMADYDESYNMDKESFVEMWLEDYYKDQVSVMEDYEDDPLVQYGWYNEDLCSMRYRER